MHTLPTLSQQPHAVVVMGVAGCGKSSIAHAVAAGLNCSLVEGDDFHTQSNLDKMRAGIALTDADRAAWLDSLSAQLASYRLAGKSVVLTCSALKRSYRDRLRRENARLLFVFLDIDRDRALGRVSARQRQHLFPVSLVDSQFAALERPDAESGVLRVDATRPLDQVCADVYEWLQGQPF